MVTYASDDLVYDTLTTWGVGYRTIATLRRLGERPAGQEWLHPWFMAVLDLLGCIQRGEVIEEPFLAVPVPTVVERAVLAMLGDDWSR